MEEINIVPDGEIVPGVNPELIEEANVPDNVEELVVEPADELSENEEEGVTFADLGVRPDLLHAIQDMGFEHPMPIQQLVIPHLLNEDGDVV
ncbi:MAG: hypothetical protein K2M14_02445, partial [Muribaculaceae bacterium]|nr:hypothetical protein [Muribaculaceae bacterium]